MKAGGNWRKKGYRWITITGAAAVIVTGYMLLDLNVAAREGQAPISVTQALSAAITYKAGETVTLGKGLPRYAQPMDHKVPVDQMRITTYTSGGEKLKVQIVRGDWIRLNHSEFGSFWVPGWYASKESQTMKRSTPQNFTLRAGSKLYLYPGSQTSWPSASSLTDHALIVASTKEWYGVSVPPRTWNKESNVYRPAIIWVRAKDVQQRVNVADGWFGNQSSMSIADVRHLTDILLDKSTTSKQAAQWLGEPDWKEHSQNLNETHVSMSIGQTWRYEREDAQFLVTFSKTGKLVQTRWNIPVDDRNNVVPSDWNFSRSDDYQFTTQILGKTLPATLPWKSTWTNQGKLNYPFLQAATADVLLMKGDDGGFSGMHYDKSVYALDRHTGENVWEIHAGFGALQAQLDAKRDGVTIFTSYAPGDKEYKDRIRHIKLSDGKVQWEYKTGSKLSLRGITAAENVVVVDSPVAEGSSQGRITVLNSSNGKTLWTKKLSAGYQLFNQTAADPYVMYWEKNQLVAADPLSGRTVWSIKTGKPTVDHIENDPYFDGITRLDPFAEAKPERWMLLGDQWVLVDLNSGKKLAHFQARNGQRFEVLNDGMLLIRENKQGEHYGDYSDFTTTLYDAKNDKKRWTLNDKVERGFVADDQLYVIKNGYPAALDYQTGKTRWDAQYTISSLRYPTNQGSYLVIDDQLLLPMGEDLLIMNKEDGTLVGRVHDVVMGSPEHRDRDAKNGTINRIGDEIYIGSSNGRFSLYHVNDLKTDISR
ncbi:PQQ-binding-like beta-propeller repeat protein [Paenibacillus xylanilyticus]|uniref:outer membrane protein assembly factor BamB family protein n=1 Tax=Paenibacillus xylanilyticus TaxID=248903 RepID=UPI00129D554A|nr:PQQ-binding-like beta-propeller repeat protein [Paenibacillus xylanilyticus]